MKKASVRMFCAGTWLHNAMQDNFNLVSSPCGETADSSVVIKEMRGHIVFTGTAAVLLRAVLCLVPWNMKPVQVGASRCPRKSRPNEICLLCVFSVSNITS